MLPGRSQWSNFHQTHRRAGPRDYYPKLDIGHQPTTQGSQVNMTTIGIKGINFQLPGTFISPPIHRHWKKPRVLLFLLATRLKKHLWDWMGVIGHSLGAKEHMFSLSRSPFKLNRAAIIPAAKALHATMNDAIARGDKQTLLRICVDSLGNELCAKVERLLVKRNNTYPLLKKALNQLTRDQRAQGLGGAPVTAPLFRWELVKYNKPWTYPRIVDHKLAMLPIGARQMMIVRQAVVAIASRQKLTEVKPAGVVDGRLRMDDVQGAREVDLLEYVVMIAKVDADHRTHEWTLLGTAKEATTKSWNAQLKLLKDMEENRVAVNDHSAGIEVVRGKKGR